MSYHGHIHLRHVQWDAQLFEVARERDARYRAAWNYAHTVGHRDRLQGKKPTQNPFTCLCDRAAWMEGYYENT